LSSIGSGRRRFFSTAVGFAALALWFARELQRRQPLI